MNKSHVRVKIKNNIKLIETNCLYFPVTHIFALSIPFNPDCINAQQPTELFTRDPSIDKLRLFYEYYVINVGKETLADVYAVRSQNTRFAK